MKSVSVCLDNSVAKDAEVPNISHRKEDSDRVPEETLYSRLEKHLVTEINHDFYVEDSRRCVETEKSSTEDACPLRLTKVEDESSVGDDLMDERGIPNLIAEVEPDTVNNINSSSYKKGHYSTNACDSIRLNSMSQTDVQQCLHIAELIPDDTNCRSRDYRHSSSLVRDKESENNPCSTENCLNKLSKSRSKRFSSIDERNDRKALNEDSSCENEDSPPSIEEKKALRQADFRDNDVLYESSSRSDDECCDINSAKVIVVQKYAMEKDMESEDCESPIAVDATTDRNRTDSIEFCGLNSEEVLEMKTSIGNVLKCYNNIVPSQEEEEEEEEEEETVVMKSDAYIANVETNIRPEVTTLHTIEVDSRVHIREENNAANFNNVQTSTDYDNDLTSHKNLQDNHDSSIKRSMFRQRDYALEVASSKSSRKSQKRLSSTKSKFGSWTEDVQDDGVDAKNHSKTGKSKNKSTKSQRRDRQRSATTEIGEADDDSGIQGDIYEFSEKESNLEDIGLLSIIRRGKHDSRHASSSTSPVPEMQCNDEYSKTEPPVLVPEEPWPPINSTARSEHGADSNNGVQLEENCDAEETLER